jgi:DNA-binding transcriptional ArsR family regulator
MSDTPEPVSERDVARLRIENPRTIRALAHPARLTIIDALIDGRELTATECAELTGLSPSATAYHLTFLERYGLVEPAPARADRRQRPWRATGRPTEVDIDSSTPAGGSAAAAFVSAIIDATRVLAVDFARNEHAEPEEWRKAVLENSDLWLTAEELQRVADQLGAALEPYQRRGREQRPAGSRRVKVMNIVVPHPSGGPEAGAGRRDA